MTSKNVYAVNVSIDFEMFVVAPDKEAAWKVAAKHARQELDELYPERDATFSAREASVLLDGKVDALCWGDDEDKTVAEYMAEKKQRELDAEEARRIEANQLKLPLEVKP